MKVHRDDEAPSSEWDCVGTWPACDTDVCQSLCGRDKRGAALRDAFSTRDNVNRGYPLTG